MKTSDKIQGNSKRGEGFDPRKTKATTKNNPVVENPLALTTSSLTDSLGGQLAEFAAVAQGYDQQAELAAEGASQWLCDALSGKVLAQKIMAKTAAKLQETTPTEMSGNFTGIEFVPPAPSNEQAAEQFYTTTSFLRGRNPKALGPG